MTAFQKTIPFNQLLKLTTWGETLRQHLVHGFIAELERAGDFNANTKYKSTVEFSKGYVLVKIDT